MTHCCGFPRITRSIITHDGVTLSHRVCFVCGDRTPVCSVRVTPSSIDFHSRVAGRGARVFLGGDDDDGSSGGSDGRRTRVLTPSRTIRAAWPSGMNVVGFFKENSHA
jgi:hypothetical protein